MRWLFLAVLVAVAVLSSGFVVGFGAVGHGGTPSASQSGVRAFATDAVVPTSNTGADTFEFYPGLAVYFTATDPSDTTGTVAINDQNASRDGLTNPVASWSVTFTGGAYYSWQTGKYYQIPLSLKLGGVWNITVSGATAGFASTEFFVYTYVVNSQASPAAVLPGQPGLLYYNLLWAANGAADTMVTSLVVMATYLDATSGTMQTLPGFPETINSPAPLSSVPYTTPATASTSAAGGITFHLYANTTAGTTPNTAVSVSFAGVGELYFPAPVTLAPCPSCAAQAFFGTGSPAYASFTGMVRSQTGFSVPAVGVRAQVAFLANGTAIPSAQVPGSPPSTLTLNSAGQGTVFFWVDTPPFSTTAFDTVNVTLVDPWASANESWSETNFSTGRVTGTPAFSVAFQYSHYFPGEQAVVNWQLANYSSSGPVAGWTVGQWLAGDASTLNIFATGSVNSAAPSGSFTLTVPSSFTGTLLIDLVANNATAEIATAAETNVSAFVLLLTPSQATYLPGDTISVTTNIQGVEPAGLSLFETVSDPSGRTLSSGTVSVNGTFQFTVPAVATPFNVSIVVTAQTTGNGIVATQTLDLFEAASFVWSTHIATTSMYLDNSYQPGQTIQIAYSLTSIGTAELPTEFEIVVQGVTSGSIPAHAILMQTTASSGQVAMTIPSNAPNGQQLVGVEAITGPGPTGAFLSYITINIQSSPPALNYELGAGTGFTIAWLILLILIVVVAVVLVMMVRARGRAGPPKPPVQPYSPPSGPSPSAPGTGVWQETPPGGPGNAPMGGEQPPLPPPAT